MGVGCHAFLQGIFQSQGLNLSLLRLKQSFNSLSKESPCNAGDLGSILSQEDPLEEGMATHSSILAWRIPWTEESGGLQSMGLQRVRHD